MKSHQTHLKYLLNRRRLALNVAPVKKSSTLGGFLEGEYSNRRRGVCNEIEKTMNRVKLNGSRMSLYDLRKDVCSLVDHRVFTEIHGKEGD